MLEMLELPFMRRALEAGLLVSLVSGYFGVFVVQRRMSFMGSGLAHSAFGGVALALLLGWEPIAVAAVFTVAVAVAIKWMQGHSGLAADTSIGIFFSVSMALGVVFLAMREQYSAEAMSYLFGDILLISRADIWTMRAVAVAALLTLPLWGRWAFATFDREQAEANRLSVELHDYLLAVALAVTIVVAMKIVGIVLVAAFLVIPSAAARLVAPTFAAMTLLAMAAGAAAVLGGLLASYHFDLPSGAVIILVQTGLLFAVLPFRR